MMSLLAPIALTVAAVASPQAAIEAELAASSAGWDAGDIERFIAVYADDAVYVSGKDVVRGKASIAQRYAKSFGVGANSRGVLSIQPVAWRTLSSVHMLLVARWTLTPPGAPPQVGLTTLLFERRKAGWRIISDHSS